MALEPGQYHKSVLVDEVLEYLIVGQGKIYVDATLGGGGHTRQILLKDPTCTVIGMDWDQEALKRNAPVLEQEFGKRFIKAWGNFAHIYRILTKLKIKKVDGILADFGTSQWQIHHQAGFSFSSDTPLDMRMSPAHYYFTAADVLNRYTVKSLSKIFRELGEERFATQIAKAIVEKRKTDKFKTTKQLAQLVDSVIPTKISVKKRIHPATKVFQALRIYVNKELENIQTFLKAGTTFLNKGGRFVCISFHSLEDRIVKNFFRDNQEQLTVLTRKPVTGTEEEIEANPSSRSAKLRAAEKK